MAAETVAVADELKQLRSQTASWTMAQDTALARAMSAFAAKLDRRLQSVGAAVDNFALSIERSQVRLSNAANELSALSRTQFLEQRVYDEEEPSPPEVCAKVEPPQKSEEEQQTALVHDCAKLAQAGIRAIEQFPLATDTDEVEGAVVPNAPVIPEYSYDELALPFVIGTPEFLANDNCGIFEHDERDTMRTTVNDGTRLDEDDDDDDDDDEDDEDNDDEDDEEEHDDLNHEEFRQNIGDDSANIEYEDDDESEEEEWDGTSVVRSSQATTRSLPLPCCS